LTYAGMLQHDPGLLDGHLPSPSLVSRQKLWMIPAKYMGTSSPAADAALAPAKRECPQGLPAPRNPVCGLRVSGRDTVRSIVVILATFLCLQADAASVRQDILIADFEGPDYGLWRVEGDAFGSGPAKGTLPGQMKVDGFRGRGLVNSFNNGDRSIGALTSPEFEIARSNINFLIGGGGYAGETFMELLVDGRAVRTATGTNLAPGGSEELQWQAWKVSDLAGRHASIRIIDKRTGGWGHINVDHIHQSDSDPPRMIRDASRGFHISGRYLQIPIRNGAPRRNVTVFVAGKMEVANAIELADTAPDWWAFVDASAWRGKSVSLVVDRLPEDSSALSLIEQGDQIKDAANLYRESLRPQFHFSSRRGWLNDPNGLAFFNGQYHLFYQHNPYGYNWGNMHWGHAVSRDLVHWRELGDVLAPDRFGPMYSGSAVVDADNTGGFGAKKAPALVLLYTAAGKPTVQCLAASTDGRTFTKFTGNPVLGQVTEGNRDPKVFWYEPSRQWVMALYVALPEAKHSIQFFTSPNLRDWTRVGTREGGTRGDNYLFECPDFFELPLDGDVRRKRWVLTAANGQYAVGTFDGREFRPDAERLQGPYGNVFYAAQTFHAEPKGRRIQIGWLRAPSPGMPFNQCMSLPQELRLVGTLAGPRLVRLPVTELEQLRGRMTNLKSITIHPNAKNPLKDSRAELVELRAEFEPAKARTHFVIRGAIVTYDGATQELEVNGLKAAAPLSGNGAQRIIVYLDRTSIEVFAGDGRVYMPAAFCADPADLELEVRAEGAPVVFRELNVYELKTAWEPRS